MILFTAFYSHELFTANCFNNKIKIERRNIWMLYLKFNKLKKNDMPVLFILELILFDYNLNNGIFKIITIIIVFFS